MNWASVPGRLPVIGRKVVEGLVCATPNINAQNQY
jgi:hypothetical protein